MQFEWDDDKSEACFAQRGFDFAYAAMAFFDPNRIVTEDKPYNYGEDRYQLTGMIHQRLFIVVYTPRHHTNHLRAQCRSPAGDRSASISVGAIHELPLRRAWHA